jgi:hypothetical protein
MPDDSFKEFVLDQLMHFGFPRAGEVLLTNNTVPSTVRFKYTVR